MSGFVKQVRLRDPRTRKLVRVTVDLDIDEHILAESLGQRALKNKSRKSKLAVGIVAKIRDVKEIE